MATRARPADRGREIARSDLHSVVGELRRARIQSGLSLRAVSAAAGLDHARVWRIEQGLVQPSLEELAALGAVVGLDVRLRSHPAGDPLRDAGQLRLLGRLHERLGPGLGWKTEVPLPIDGDRRAWDAVIRGADWVACVEAETVLNDAQALERRLSLKIRDGAAETVILLVSDTRGNRRSIAVAVDSGAFSTLPLRSRAILAALGRGAYPGASGIVIL